jgi:hypothetical protein
MKSDEKTKEIFQRVNHTAEEVAALKQKVEDMPDVIVGRILQKVNFNPGKIED